MAENLYHLLHRAMEKKGTDTFIIYENRNISFNSVFENVNCYVKYFKRKGVGYGDCVWIQLPNVPEFVYSIFAAYKIGAIPVLINPMARCYELESYMRIADPSLIIMQSENYCHYEKFHHMKESFRFVFIDKQEVLDEIYQDKKILSDEVAEVTDEHPAAIIFTSAEDGTPGGAMITHKGIVETVRASNEFAVKQDDVFLAVLPLFHAFGLTTSLFLSLFNFCKVYLINKFSVKKTAHALMKGEVTVFCGIPLMFEILAKIVHRTKALKRVRACVSGGEAIPIALQQFYVQSFEIEIRQGYGLTEASPIVTWNVPHIENRHGSIGIPLSYNEVKMIKDGVENPSQGELYVCGMNVVPGYLNNPEKTKEKIDNGWLKTGDIVEKDKDGYYFIRGRSKNMIIRNGLNVYPEEVKRIFLHHPGVDYVEIIGNVNINEDYSQKDTFKAKIWRKSGAVLSEKDFREWCVHHISAYKIPDEIEIF